MNKNIFVSDVNDLISADDLEKITYQEFIGRFLRMSKLPETKYVFIHLYHEGTDFKEKIIDDPMSCPVSEIIGAIFYYIINENNTMFWEELLSKIIFISQNKKDYYKWGSTYFDNFDECFLWWNPSENNISTDSVISTSLKICQSNVETFVNETHNALQEAFSHHG